MLNISNIVATATTSPIDLEDMYLFMSAAGHEVKLHAKFPAVFAKLASGSCAMFSTGTITLNGVKSLEQLKCLADEVCELLQDMGRTLSTPRIVNIAASFKRDVKVNLNTVAGALYVPDYSNAAEVQLLNSCKALLHSTGNGIVTGAKSINELERSYNQLLNLLNGKTVQGN